MGSFEAFASINLLQGCFPWDAWDERYIYHFLPAFLLIRVINVGKYTIHTIHGSHGFE